MQCVILVVTRQLWDNILSAWTTEWVVVQFHDYANKWVAF